MTVMVSDLSTLYMVTNCVNRAGQQCIWWTCYLSDCAHCVSINSTTFTHKLKSLRVFTIIPKKPQLFRFWLWKHQYWYRISVPIQCHYGFWSIIWYWIDTSFGTHPFSSTTWCLWMCYSSFERYLLHKCTLHHSYNY